MKKLIIIAGMHLVLASLAFGADLKTYRATYEKELEEILLSHGMQTIELAQQYTKALDALLANVKSAGDLNRTTAVMNEIERFGKEREMPSDPPALLDLQSLQAAYTRKASVYQSDKAKRVITLSARYDDALGNLQRGLVSSDKLDDAMAVQEERKRVATSLDTRQADDTIKQTSTEAARPSGIAPPKEQLTEPQKEERIRIQLGSGVKGIENFRNGARAYSNRDFTWLGIPVQIPASRFVMIPGGHHHDPVVVKVTRPGRLLLALNVKTDIDDDEYLLKHGWRKTPYAFSYSHARGQMMVYEKRVTRGDLELPRLAWGGPVLLLP